jgi:hypothetical protein
VRRGRGQGAAPRELAQHERSGSGPLEQRRVAHVVRTGEAAGARDAGVAADKWSAMMWGPVGSNGVRCERDATLTRGPGSTVPPDSVFKPNQFYFKRIQICAKL